MRNWKAFYSALAGNSGRDGSAETTEGDTSYVIKTLRTSADPLLFIRTAPVKAEDMYNFLLHTPGRCGVFAKVTQRILTDNKDKLLIWSAGKSVHHNLRGGLLLPTYRMTKTAAYVASIYNKEPSICKCNRNINVELLIAGTILHDIGKLYELDTNTFGAARVYDERLLDGAWVHWC